MAKTNKIKNRVIPLIYPLITPKERLYIWEQCRGMLKGRTKQIAKELKKIRKEWDRKLPLLKR